ncbi:MAG: DUF4956 domain-containing protein [Lachnospiraceae bacterium]|nr:DUF4956 domain-containing protein [Lachnospiraceae bacterium]
MLSELFTLSGSYSLEQLIVSGIVAIILGLIIAGIYMATGEYTKNFVVTLALMPIIVGSVILMVGGNVGTGVAVAGTFSLIRFRSVQGTSREITSIFFTMAVGLAVGMGELSFACLITLLIGLAMFVMAKTGLGTDNRGELNLRIVIPENLNYEGAFDDIFEKYTRKATLEKAKTTNMGSMYDLTYKITMKNGVSNKEMMDEIRSRNGNLTVACGRVDHMATEL